MLALRQRGVQRGRDTGLPLGETLVVCRPGSFADAVALGQDGAAVDQSLVFLTRREKGAPGGVAELDESGKVPEEQLPLDALLRPFGPVEVTISLSWTGSGPWTQTVPVAGVTTDMELLELSLAKVEDDDARARQERTAVWLSDCGRVPPLYILFCLPGGCRDKRKSDRLLHSAGLRQLRTGMGDAGEQTSAAYLFLIWGDLLDKKEPETTARRA